MCETVFLSLPLESSLKISDTPLISKKKIQLLSKAVVLVFANKTDVRGSMTAAEISEAFALHAIKDREWHIQSCCGLTGQGLFEGLDWISSKFNPANH